MSKLRKSVIKQKERSQVGQREAPPRATVRATDSVLRDNYLYSSAKKAYAFAVIFFTAAVWCAGNFWPFDKLRDLNGTLVDLLSGVFSFLLFMFVVFAWGNTLEIQGNVIEWKHVLFCIIVVSLIAAWSGLLGFGLFIFAAFGLLTFMWYANR
nr:hypothetical protein [Candidatus Sigynarchaeota archaeon]